jgi:hypothetical protein
VVLSDMVRSRPSLTDYGFYSRVSKVTATASPRRKLVQPTRRVESPCHMVSDSGGSALGLEQKHDRSRMCGHFDGEVTCPERLLPLAAVDTGGKVAPAISHLGAALPSTDGSC